MRWLICVEILVIGSGLLLAADEKVHAVRFSDKDAGKVPSGWKAEHTGKGEGSVWKVIADDSGPTKSGYVLAQTAESPNAYFNICVADDTRYKDLEMSVAFKAIRGRNDQGGGLVWRYRDHDNYYICRMNPLEDNYRVYKVVAGKRHQLETKEGLKVKTGEWHRLKVNMEGDHIECYLDGKKLLDIRDNAFKEGGKVGLWTKSDAQTHFDGFEVRSK
jgi:hypothetical protein